MRISKTQVAFLGVFVTISALAVGCAENSSSNNKRTVIRTSPRGKTSDTTNGKAGAAGVTSSAQSKLTGAKQTATTAAQTDAQIDSVANLALAGQVTAIEKLPAGRFKLERLHHLLIAQNGKSQQRVLENLNVDVDDKGVVQPGALTAISNSGAKTNIRDEFFATNVPALIEIKADGKGIEAKSSLKLSHQLSGASATLAVDNPDAALNSFIERFQSGENTLSNQGIYAVGPKGSQHFFAFRLDGDRLIVSEDADKLAQTGRFRSLILTFKKVVEATPAAPAPAATTPPAAPAEPASADPKAKEPTKAETAPEISATTTAAPDAAVDAEALSR